MSDRLSRVRPKNWESKGGAGGIPPNPPVCPDFLTVPGKGHCPWQEEYLGRTPHDHNLVQDMIGEIMMSVNC